jgi:hypothetical protein
MVNGLALTPRSTPSATARWASILARSWGRSASHAADIASFLTKSFVSSLRSAVPRWVASSATLSEVTIDLHRAEWPGVPSPQGAMPPAHAIEHLASAQHQAPRAGFPIKNSSPWRFTKREDDTGTMRSESANIAASSCGRQRPSHFLVWTSASRATYRLAALLRCPQRQALWALEPAFRDGNPSR